jgi:hypothetical protein
MKRRRKVVAAAAAPAGPSQEELLIQIRDLLKKIIPVNSVSRFGLFQVKLFKNKILLG